MKKFLIHNMGCKANQLEGDIIKENLQNNGFEETTDLKLADYYVLNSCTVTHKSDNEAITLLHHAKNQNPSIKTVITGCVAQIEKENLLRQNGIDIVIGNDEKLDISRHLNEKCAVKDIMQLNSFHKVFVPDLSKTRANLKIQDGCNNRCAYCIIPFARGKNRSANVEFILEQIKMYEDADFKEIILTGIHIGQWGMDFPDKKNLLYLLEEIEKNSSIQRYRLGSLNPLEIDAEMLNFLKNSEKFCPHFHLSLQSMCDKTLKNMNRFYSAERELDLIEQISATFKNPFLGSDIIAGFVGETEEDFAITVENLKKSKLSKIHTFPYSIRTGTVAAERPEQLSQIEKDRRASIIKQVSKEKYAQFLSQNLNTTQEVLIEKNLDKHTGYLKGKTKNYINVLIKPNEETKNLRNEIKKVKIREIFPTVIGEII
jgi:threonylcarbamoyladenosine tRNA methylthiotransferase MtaB